MRVLLTSLVLLLMLGCKDKGDTNGDLGESLPQDRMDATSSHPDVFLLDEADVSLDEGVQDAMVAQLSVEFTAPMSDQVIELGETLTIAGQVTTDTPEVVPFVATNLMLNDVVSLSVELDENGRFETTLDADQQGENVLVFTARLYPNVVATSEVRFRVVDCTYAENFDETFNPDVWTIYECTRANNDRNGPCLDDVETLIQRDGWLELTNNQLFTASAMLLTGFGIAPNNLDLEFEVSTGKCEVPGDCDRQRIDAGGGLAVSIWNIGPDDFEQVWANRLSHFLLSPEKLRDSGFRRPESIHIEFDTYSNSCSQICGENGYDGCGNPATDPSPNNHIQLQFNGHPSGFIDYSFDESSAVLNYCGEQTDAPQRSEAWRDYPDLDDNRWHRIRLKILGDNLKVWAVPNTQQIEDSMPLIDETLPGFVFKGGLLSISAGSGVNGNYHRLDNLRIKGDCR